MKPAPFEYAAPNTVGEAISLLQSADEDDVKILAGGQSLMPMLSMRLARPSLLVDIGRIDGLSYIRESDGALAIGAMTTKRDVEDSEVVARTHPLFLASTVAIGHPQIRNRGTVGGSMVQADPAAEYPAVALVLDAEMVVVGPQGERVIPADDFFVTFFTTAIEPSEILTEVRLPKVPSGTGWSFQEVARRHGDFAIVGGAFSLRVEGGQCVDTRIALFGASDRALRVPEAEALCNGHAPGPELFRNAGAKVAELMEDAPDDVHASAAYRRDLAGTLTRRGLQQAAERAGG